MIRWDEDYSRYRDEHEWLGYLGSVIICKIDWDNHLLFYPTNDGEIYTKLSSAKRGAERMLAKFLKDANLEVIGNIFEGEGGE